MQTVSITQLKNSLSAYLRDVKAGEEVLITDRGRPIARLVRRCQVPILWKSTSKKWKEKGFSDAGQVDCQTISGTCRVQPIQRDWCVKQFHLIGMKAGEILGRVGSSPPLRRGINLSRCTRHLWPRPLHGRLVGYTHRVYFRFHAAVERRKFAIQ